MSFLRKLNEAYDIFLNVYMKKYEKHCPIVKINTTLVNHKQCGQQNCLKNACHKKNNSYKNTEIN